MEPVNFICFKCKHYRDFEIGCDAFPDGIPDEIISGENEHSKPLSFQTNDIVFEVSDTEKKYGLKERMNFPSVPILTPPKKKIKPKQ